MDKTQEEQRIPDGYFKLKEEIEFRRIGMKTYETGYVGIYGPFESTIPIDKIDTVRRIPAWKPQVGEKVFVLTPDDHVDIEMVISIRGNEVMTQDVNGYDYIRDIRNMKPYDESSWGKRWSEI